MVDYSKYKRIKENRDKIKVRRNINGLLERNKVVNKLIGDTK